MFFKFFTIAVAMTSTIGATAHKFISSRIYTNPTCTQSNEIITSTPLDHCTEMFDGNFMKFTTENGQFKMVEYSDTYCQTEIKKVNYEINFSIGECHPLPTGEVGRYIKYSNDESNLTSVPSTGLNRDRRGIFGGAVNGIRHVISNLVNSIEDVALGKGYDLAHYESDYFICRVNATESCSLTSLRRQQALFSENESGHKNGWIIVPGGDGRCLDGTPFAFQVFPGQTDRMWMHFQQGGACFDYLTCVEFPTAITRFLPEKSGILDFSKKDANPVVEHGMTAVVNNFCSGDVFAGDSVYEAHNPEGTKNATIYFAGVNNTKTVLNWIKANEEESATPLLKTISGSSAGSIGAFLWMNHIAERFNGFHRVILDSYVGLFPKELGTLVERFGACHNIIPVLGFGEAEKQACEQKKLYDLPALMKSNMEKNPNIYVHYVGSASDLVQKLFYSLVFFGATRYKSLVEFAMTLSSISSSFSEKQATILAENDLVVPFFSSYIKPDSQKHVFVTNAVFYFSSDIFSSVFNFCNIHIATTHHSSKTTVLAGSSTTDVATSTAASDSLLEEIRTSAMQEQPETVSSSSNSEFDIKNPKVAIGLAGTFFTVSVVVIGCVGAYARSHKVLNEASTDDLETAKLVQYGSI
eukprot:Pgem_evm1s1141